MSQSTIFQSCWDGANASWVINQYFRGVKCLAQGHNTAGVGFEPPTSRSGVRHSTTEPPRSPFATISLTVYGKLIFFDGKQFFGCFIVFFFFIILMNKKMRKKCNSLPVWEYVITV